MAEPNEIFNSKQKHWTVLECVQNMMGRPEHIILSRGHAFEF
jgi:hypothetical protein